MTNTIKPGGWVKVKTGLTQAGRDVEATVSKGVFRFTGAALMDRNVPVEPGTRVRLTKLYGCPPPGTMGQWWIADADTGRFLAMVAYGSLKPDGKYLPRGAA